MLHALLFDQVKAGWLTPQFVDAVGRIDTSIFSRERLTPEPSKVFRALTFFEPRDTKVVILGQDPYYQRGKANGLAFGVDPSFQRGKVRDSLANIAKSVRAGTGLELRDTSLERWAEQGVLLLNTALTTEIGVAGAHANSVWESVIDAILYRAESVAEPIWMLWGSHAQAAAEGLLLNDPLRVRRSSHPSPLSANRPTVYGFPAFLGASMFRKDDPVVWGEET